MGGAKNTKIPRGIPVGVYADRDCYFYVWGRGAIAALVSTFPPGTPFF